jgi:hypothetical protein
MFEGIKERLFGPPPPPTHEDIAREVARRFCRVDEEWGLKTVYDVLDEYGKINSLPRGKMKELFHLAVRKEASEFFR